MGSRGNTSTDSSSATISAASTLSSRDPDAPPATPAPYPMTSSPRSCCSAKSSPPKASTPAQISQFGRRGLHPIVFVLNNSGYLSERMLCKDMALSYNDIAARNYAELPHALGCQGWFTARVSTCGELDGALKTAEQADGAAYIEVVTAAYEAPPLYKKLHENVKSFYKVQ